MRTPTRLAIVVACSLLFAVGASPARAEPNAGPDPRAAEAAARQKAAEMEVAKAQLKLVEAQYERFRKLTAAGAVSQEEVETAELEVRRARLRIELLNATDDVARLKIEREMAQAEVAAADVRLKRVQSMYKLAVVSAAEVEEAELNLVRAKFRLEGVGADAAMTRKLQAQIATLEMEAAKKTLERVRKQFEAGVAPREAVEMAEKAVLDAEQKRLELQRPADVVPGGR